MGAPGAIVGTVGFRGLRMRRAVCQRPRGAPDHRQSRRCSCSARRGARDLHPLGRDPDNPLLFARLQQLGVETFFIPQSTYTETTNLLGQREISVEYVSRGPGGLDYTRNLVVTFEPALAPVPSTGTFYHLGSRGEVRFSYANLLDAAARARIRFDVGDDSVPLDHGMTDFCFPSAAYLPPRQLDRDNPVDLVGHRKFNRGLKGGVARGIFPHTRARRRRRLSDTS